MGAAVHRAAHRVGRRGAVLALKGVMAALFGVSQLIQPIPNTSGIRLLLLLMPAHVWGWAWVVAGGVALACVPMRQGRDWPGFAAVYLMASTWALGNLASWWLYGNARGWISALIWAAFGGVAAVVAAWPEPRCEVGEVGPYER
jgi:hypothetical protein